MTAKSMEEIRDGLIDFYPEFDAAQLGSIMQRAFAAAEMAGRYEAQEDI